MRNSMEDKRPSDRVAYPELMDNAYSTSKPDKENSKNAAFHFPAYISDEITLDALFYNAARVEYVVPYAHRQIVHNSFTIIPKLALSDQRTTCMIKNIPNKYTSKMLMDFINETHFGQYDFLYLRIDFKNRCNVGYAFINFINCEVLLSFYKRIHGRRWPVFSSTKIAELTYASVQGLANLKQRFKRSSVMQEDPEFRPKLFYVAGTSKGKEKHIFE